MKKRICVSCREIKDRENFIKITKTKDKKIILNPTSKEVGRSCYICNNQDCIKQAIKQNKIVKALGIKEELNIEDIYDKLKQMFETNLP